MSTAQHTPGPWRFEPESPKDVRLKRAHWKIGQVDAPALGVGLAFGSDEANARLIAAAPDLLAKCQKVVAWLDTLAADAERRGKDTRFQTLSDANKLDAQNYRRTANDIRSTINKATGAA